MTFSFEASMLFVGWHELWDISDKKFRLNGDVNTKYII